MGSVRQLAFQFRQLAVTVTPGAYDTHGFRVPAVIVSPYARPDCVLSDIFDHTSVLKLIEEKWNLPAPALAWGTW